ncbi:helix-turn-helix transcriptional regulator [Daejeonella sp.]|uniref:helix-turn-helix domain-containing protein n=1 Tax=Daejeonella sp. TaxID=2805397 RepID=UPI0034389590
MGEVNSILGFKLRKLRVNSNYSQLFVANCLGISRNAYVGWENGTINFTLEQIQRVCEFYNIDIIEFLKEIPSNKNNIL